MQIWIILTISLLIFVAKSWDQEHIFGENLMPLPMRTNIYSAFRESVTSLMNSGKFHDVSDPLVIFEAHGLAVLKVKQFGFERRLYVFFERSSYPERALEYFKKHYEIQKSKAGIYIERITTPVIQNRKNMQFLSTVYAEFLSPANYPLFKASTPGNRDHHTRKLIRLIGQIVRAFAVLNHLANVYHGNIKLSNLMIKKVKGEYFPVITNLDRSITMRHIYQSTEELMYEPEYQPPEIENLIIKTVFDNKNIKINKVTYYLDLNFKEEAYALGTTLLKLIKINEEHINVKNKSLERVKKILTLMIDPDPELRNSNRKTLKLLIEHSNTIRKVLKPITWIPQSYEIRSKSKAIKSILNGSDL